jgi:hypothetical protein
MTRHYYETTVLLFMTGASFVMLGISLWMAWSVWREIRCLVARVANRMDDLMRKQRDALSEVANGIGETKRKL